MILIVSREARVLAVKHAWNCCGRSAYGILLGFRYKLIAALPVASVRTWSDFDAEAFATSVLPFACQLADSLHLQIVGYYASWESGLVDARRCPLRHEGFFLEHELECCPHCSITRYFKNGRRVTADRVAECVGRRLTDTINQKRIVSRWNKMLGRRSYLDSERR